MSSQSVFDKSDVIDDADPRVIILRDPATTSEGGLDVNTLLNTCNELIIEWFAFSQAQLDSTSLESQHNHFQALWQVVATEKMCTSRFITAFDQEEAIAHQRSMHLYAWMPLTKHQDLASSQLFLYVFTLRRHPNVVHGFLQHTLSLPNANFHFSLYAGHGPTLRAYQANFRKLWPIESFRIFDHICAACEYLHSLQPERVLHNALDDQHIVLDGQAVARGRSEAFLAGPIRLAYFDRARFGPQNFGPLSPNNPYSIEAEQFGQTLDKYLNIGVSDAHPRNCHPGLLIMLSNLLSKTVIVGGGIQKNVNNCQGLMQWLGENGHVTEDFKDNMLCYQGNRPPCADPLDRPAREIVFPPPRPMSLGYWQTFPEDRRRPFHLDRDNLVRYCHDSMEDLRLFDNIVLLSANFSDGKGPRFESWWHVYPGAQCAYLAVLGSAVDKALLQEAITKREPLAMRTVYCPLPPDLEPATNWFKDVFAATSERHPNLMRFLYFFAYNLTEYRYVYFALLASAGVPLDEFREKHNDVTFIELFRVFDHVCSACDYLHHFRRRRRLVYVQPDAKHIMLDQAAVARGRQHAYIDAPIKLAEWDELPPIEHDDQYQQTLATTEDRLRAGVVLPEAASDAKNTFLVQGGILGRTIVTMMCEQIFPRGSYKKWLLNNYFRNCRLPQVFRYLFHALCLQQLMAGASLQAHLARALRTDAEVHTYFQAKGYTPDDFRSNVAVFRGNNRDVKFMFRQRAKYNRKNNKS